MYAMWKLPSAIHKTRREKVRVEIRISDYFWVNNLYMSTAQAFYEIYKSLPKKTRKEVLELLQDEIVLVSRSAVTEAAVEIRSLKIGKSIALSLDDFFEKLKS